jgi:hypothetical protein
MNVFGVPALLQDVYWWWMHHLTPWDITEIDVERAIQQIGVPVMVCCAAATTFVNSTQALELLRQRVNASTFLPQITHGNSDRVVDFNDGVRYVDKCKHLRVDTWC